MATSQSPQCRKVCVRSSPVIEVLILDISDPIFFLHHTQLDRLWWKWQQADLEKRLKDYSGRAVFNSTERAAGLEDLLSYGDLGPHVKVSEIMDTMAGPLCYAY